MAVRPGSMTWEPCEIYHAGRYEVPAHCCGGLAVCVGKSGYHAVVHEGSGKTISDLFISGTEARRFAEHIVNWADWAKPDDVYTNDDELAKRIYAELDVWHHRVERFIQERRQERERKDD